MEHWAVGVKVRAAHSALKRTDQIMQKLLRSARAHDRDELRRAIDENRRACDLLERSLPALNCPAPEALAGPVRVQISSLKAQADAMADAA